MSRELAGSTIVILAALLSFLCGLEPSYAQQPGFISIDCGGTRNYTDPETGIKWVTDDGYITTGSNVKISTNIREFENLETIKTSRCFPLTNSGSRRKNCYTLPVSRNSTYLVRAFVLYGNGPLLNTVKFSGSIDRASWGYFTISPDTRDSVYVSEAIFIAESEQTSVCLLDTGEGTPCLSSLELRPVGSSYRIELQHANILALVRRYSYGTPSALSGKVDFRYPLDEYDRRWEGTIFDRSWNLRPLVYTNFNQTRVNTTLAPSTEEMTILSEDKVPVGVMQSAWEDTEIRLWADTRVYDLTSTFVLRMYVWDFIPYTANDTKSVREFHTYHLKGDKEEFLQTSTLSPFDTVKISSVQVSDIIKNSNTHFIIRASNSSQRQAMINAAEIFAQIPLQQPTYPNDVRALVSLQEGFGLSPIWTGDPCSPAPWDWISCNTDSSPVRVTSLTLSDVKLNGVISPSIGNLTELTHLWLTDTGLSGTIPNEIGLLKNLRTLHLNNNNLSGPIPTSLAGLPELVELYIQNNDVSGTVPPELLKQSKLRIQASGNPKLKCDGPCDTFPSGNSRSKVGLIIGAVCGSVVVLLVSLGAFVYLYLRPRSGRYIRPDLVEKSEHSAPDVVHRAAADNAARTFTLAEIQTATEDFHTKIAKGGFGPVYHGKLPDGQVVAVKVHSGSGHQGAREFFMEVDLLSRIHHINLVSLVGYCQEGQEQILVYRYMQNGTLREHLYGGARHTFLGWCRRLEIALDSARGLAYLHTGCNPPIIHRDVKSNNILLDDRLTAKVADFGISKVTSADTTGVDTEVKGTLGYLDPEYLITERLTQKSDVYSFGVVLLEIVTSKPPVSNGRHLKETVRNHLQDNDMKAVVDPVLEGDYYIEAMWKVVDLAMECVNTAPAGRPDMIGVVRGLEEASELERTARRAYEQPPTTRRGHSHSSSAGQRGNRNPSELLNVATSFRPRSSQASASSSQDFVTGLVPR